MLFLMHRASLLYVDISPIADRVGSAHCQPTHLITYPSN